MFVSLEDLEVVFRVYSVVMCRFDLGFKPLLTTKQNFSEYSFGEPVEHAHLWTWLDTPAAGFPQRFLLEKRLDSAGGCGCPVRIHQDKEREIPAVPADSHSMSSGTKRRKPKLPDGTAVGCFLLDCLLLSDGYCVWKED